MKLNNNLVDAVLTGTHVQDVEPFGHYMNHEVPDPYHPTTNPKTLMTYSAARNSETNLRRRYFYKYGIPRVKLSPERKDSISRQTSKSIYDDELEFDPKETEPELDYFDYEEPKVRLGRSAPSIRQPSANLYSTNNRVRTVDYSCKELARDGHDQRKIHRLVRHNIEIPAMS